MYKIAQVALLASLWAASLAQGAVTCVDGLYMIVARGTSEKPGPGDIGRVAERVAATITGSVVHSVDYPATFKDPWHVESIGNGSIAARRDITEYAQQCPGKIALLGYSQGAQVIGNSVCGDKTGTMNDTNPNVDPFIKALQAASGEHIKFAEGPAVDKTTVGNKIISVVLMGDPTYKDNLDFDKGTALTDGIWPRNWAGCDSRYTSVARSYCDVGDIFCDAASPGQTPTPHQEYVHRYGVNAVEFMIRKWNEATGANLPTDGGKEFPLIPFAR